MKLNAIVNLRALKGWQMPWSSLIPPSLRETPCQGSNAQGRGRGTAKI